MCIPHMPVAPRRKKTRAVREVRTQASRAVIRRAAERPIAEHGFVGARVQQVAAAAGMSIGTVYRAYPEQKAEMPESAPATECRRES